MTKGPVFIGGCPRSGTTALWNALSKHPNLGCAEGMWQDKELWFMAEFFGGRSKQEPARRLHGLDAEFEREGALFVHQFLKRHCASPAGRYVTAHVDNILWTHKIARLIPEARVLLLIRHPQENVWSLLNSFFSNYIRRGRDPKLIREEEIVKATEIWKERAHVVLDALAGKLGENVVVVRQERMVSEPEALAREVLQFVDEPFEQAVADALSFGIINTSFPPGREPSEKSFLEIVAVPDETARKMFFAESRQRLAQATQVCTIVKSLVAGEMSLLGYEDVANSARQTANEPASADRNVTESPASRAAELREAMILDGAGCLRDAFAPLEEVTLRVVIAANQEVRNPSVSFLVRDAERAPLFGTTTFDEGVKLPDLAAGEELTVRFTFSAALRLGRYSACVACNSVSLPGYADNVLYHQIDDMAFFNVTFAPERPIHYKFHLPITIAVGSGRGE